MIKSPYFFVVAALIWQIFVGLILAFQFDYDQTQFTSTNGVMEQRIILALAMILLVVGLSLMTAYVARTTLLSMSFTLLLFAFSLQHYYIFRAFWEKIGAYDDSASANFNSSTFNKISYLNIGNDQQTSNQYRSASFIDAVGCTIALWGSYMGTVGRIGFNQIFILSLVVSFFYQINNQLFWRLYILDNGYGVRGFLLGGIIAIVSSLVLNLRSETKQHQNFGSSSSQMSIAFFGSVLVWCSFPVLDLSDLFTTTSDLTVVMISQVNCWLSLAASVLGCFTASAFTFRRFSLHDIIFSSLSGSIAYSACSDLNFNPAIPLSIGFAVGFICSITQSFIRGKLNYNGVVDPSGVIQMLIIPGLLSSCFSAIIQGLKPQTVTGYTVNAKIGRSPTLQGGFQIIGMLITIGFGIGVGIILGLLFKYFNNLTKQELFDDRTYFGFRLKDQSVKIQQTHSPNNNVNAKIPKTTL